MIVGILALLLRIGLVFLLAVVLTVMLLIGGFLLTPELSISSPRLQYLLARFAPAELNVEWRDAEVRLVKTGLLTKEVTLSANGLCVRYRPVDDALDTCWDRFNLGVGISFANFRPRIAYYLPLVALNGTLRADLEKLNESNAAEAPEPKDSRGGGSFDALDFFRKSLLPKWRYDGSVLELSKLDIKAGGRRIHSAVLLETVGVNRGNLTSDIMNAKDLVMRSPLVKLADERAKRALHGKGDRDRQTLRLTVFDLNAGAPSHLSGQVRLFQPKKPNEPWRLFGEAEARVRPGRAVRVYAESQVYKWNHADFDIRARIDRLAPIRNLVLRGTYRRDEVTGLVGAKLGRVESIVKSADFIGCGYSVFLSANEATMTCAPQSVKLVLLERGPIRDPAFFRLTPSFSLRIANLSWENGISADWKFDLNLRHQRFLQLSVDTSGRIMRRPVPNGMRLFFGVNGDISGGVTEFSRLVGFLRATPYAVPAPLNQLAGPLSFRLSGNVSDQGGQLHSTFKSRLRSTYQKVFVSAEADAEVSSAGEGLRPSVQADIILEDVRLSLPRLELSAPPRILPDSRFKKGLATRMPARLRARVPTRAPPRIPPMDFRVRIATAAEGRLQLATNLTKAPLPITLKYSLESGRRLSPLRPVVQLRPSPQNSGESRTVSYGQVRIGRTPLELLRRDANIESFQLDLGKDGTRRINGRLSVVYPDYSIGILLHGSVDQPTVRFESDPPLEENQIISVLLFGKPMDQLTGDQQESVSQLDAAVADAVLSFSSLYILAKTPIESIGYDPGRGMVTAQVPLGTGTSLNLGRSGSGSTEIGLRRKLTRNWVLNTSVEDGAEQDGRVMSAFVEWVKRF